MDDADEIRELIGRMSAAQRQGFHVTPKAISLVLSALRFYAAARSWMARPHADPHDDVPGRKPEKYDGPLPTIGDSRRSGIVACDVQCAGPDCWHQVGVTFDDLGLPDETVFVDIPRLRRFRCRKCGCRQVRVSPDWTDHRAQGNGRKS